MRTSTSDVMDDSGVENGRMGGWLSQSDFEAGTKCLGSGRRDYGEGCISRTAGRATAHAVKERSWGRDDKIEGTGKVEKFRRIVSHLTMMTSPE